MLAAQENALRRYENKLPAIFGLEYLNYVTNPGVLDPLNPVKSLDQLYIQASALRPLLHHLAIKWASESRGLFMFRHPAPDTELGYVEEFDSWQKAKIPLQEGDPDGGVVWAKIKAPGRSTEKVFRSYNGDVSRLLDVCRHNIVFENLADLEECCGVIAADPDVRIVRIKNRLSEQTVSKEHAGYRDVMINLRIETHETCDWGLEGHVCELQLILKDFARIKTQVGHKRYVAYRNTRGE